MATGTVTVLQPEDPEPTLATKEHSIVFGLVPVKLEGMTAKAWEVTAPISVNTCFGEVEAAVGDILLSTADNRVMVIAGQGVRRAE